MIRVLNFGASTAAGFWDPEGGWFHYLAKDLHKRTLDGGEHYQCYNLSVSGQDSSDLVERIENEIEARYREDEEYLIIVNIGGNDALYMNEKDEMRVSPDRFKENLSEILDIAKKYADNVIFLGNQPFKYEILDPLPWSAEESLKKENVQNYMDKAEEICREKEVPFISIAREVKEEEFLEKLVDGVHPGTEGHRQIYRILKKRMKKEELI